MDLVISSECSSDGCESGWTLYLEHSGNHSVFHQPNKLVGKIGNFDVKNRNQKKIDYCEEQEENGVFGHEEEEDLSMVSDASSGPPHFDLDFDEEEGFLCGGRKKQNFKFPYNCYCNKPEDFALDDTASSPIFTSKKNGAIYMQNQGYSLKSSVDYSSQGFSATHFQGRSADFQEPFGFLQSPFSTKRSKPLEKSQWS